RPDAGVGARVLEDAEAVGLERAVTRAAEGDVAPRGPAVVHRHHVLAAALRPAHGTTGSTCEPGDEDVLDREPLGAEAAADVGADDAHLDGLEPERRGQSGLVLMRRLRRQPARDAVVG